VFCIQKWTKNSWRRTGEAVGAAALCVANLLDALATVLACRRCAERSGGAGAPLILRETAFLRHLYIETIILPRQARDEHGENSKKMPFSPPAMYTRSGRRSYSHHHLSLHLPPREAAAAAAAAAHCRGRWLPLSGSCSQSTAPCTPAKKCLVAQLFLCLSRACLGKMIMCESMKWARKGVFRTAIQSSHGVSVGAGM
jgi:hypothetical protein